MSDYVTREELRHVLATGKFMADQEEPWQAALAALAALAAAHQEPATVPQQEQAQQPAYAPALTPFSQPIPVQPAPSALPTMIESIEANGKEWVRKSVFEAYQRECERLRYALEEETVKNDVFKTMHAERDAAEHRAEQAEAALAQTKREERERCAKVCDDLAEDARRTGDRFESRGDPERAYQWGHRQAQAHECGRLIRALGGEAGE